VADVRGCRNALKRLVRERSQGWSVEVSEKLAKAAQEQSALTGQKAAIEMAKKATEEKTAALQAKLKGVLKDQAEKRSGHVAPEEEERAVAPPSRGKRGAKVAAEEEEPADESPSREKRGAKVAAEEEEPTDEPASPGNRDAKANAKTRTPSTPPTQDLVQGLTMSNLMLIAYNNWVEDDPDKFDEYLAEFSSLCLRVDHA